MVKAGTGTPAALARTYGVAHNTAARWLADAGLLPADPAINEDDLRELYVTQQLPTPGRSPRSSASTSPESCGRSRPPVSPRDHEKSNDNRDTAIKSEAGKGTTLRRSTAPTEQHHGRH